MVSDVFRIVDVVVCVVVHGFIDFLVRFSDVVVYVGGIVVVVIYIVEVVVVVMVAVAVVQ